MKRRVHIKRRDGHKQHYWKGRKPRRKNYGSITSRFRIEHARKRAYARRRAGIKLPEPTGNIRSWSIKDDIIDRAIEQERINTGRFLDSDKARSDILKRADYEKAQNKQQKVHHPKTDEELRREELTKFMRDFQKIGEENQNQKKIKERFRKEGMEVYG